MAVVSVRRRVRPLRFAFVVDHCNVSDVRKAIQLNTILWGGRFNAIIPTFARTPSSWGTRCTAKEITRGYLDAFEPDFVVIGASIDAARIGVPATNAIPLDTMLTSQGLGERGMDVMGIYRWRYEHEFRFVHRNPIHLRRPAVGGIMPALWVAAVFGEYPAGPLNYFAQAFTDLGGEEIDTTVTSYVETLRTSLSPLALGNSGFKERGASGPRRTFFVLDERSPSDVIDFWNVRALGWHVIAIPLQWASDLAPAIAATIREEHQPDKILRPSFTSAHFLKGRAVPEDAFLGFVKQVAAAPNTIVSQLWLPRIWERDHRDADRTNRIELSARDEEQEVQARDKWISFTTIGPEFVESVWFERPRFANVIELRSFDLPTLAKVIPTDVSDLDGLLRWVGPANMIRNSSEGVSILTDGNGRSVTWQLPHGLQVFMESFKSKGEVALSGAGKIALRMIGLVGGPGRTRIVTDVDLVKLFGKATQSASRDVTHEQVFAALMKIEGNQKEVVQRRIDAMVRQKVIRLGMRLHCETCAQQNWFALDELRERLTCNGCLDDIAFPSAMPPRQPCWSYRPLGPFGAKGYAQGAYVVAAAIKTLSDLGGLARSTWVPSFILKTATDQLEADFGLLWEGNIPRRVGPQLILGECKTFDYFRPADISRMKHLGRAFPRAALVFATFNAGLSRAEKALIAPLANWGRKNWRNAVMVLTARELTSRFGFPFCWHHDGTEREKRMYQAIIGGPAPGTSLRRLADATHQLHLGLAPDANWPHHDAG